MKREYHTIGAFALLAFATSAFAQYGIVETYSATASVPVGTTRQFTAYVSLSPSTLTWSINDIPGGNATVGTVSSRGLYTAPAVVPMANVVTLKATSTAYPAKFGKSTITIVQPTPWVYGASPNPIPAGAFTLKLTGTGYVPTSKVLFGGTPLPTTYISPTEVRATGNVSASLAGTSVAVTINNPNPGGVTSQPKMVSIGQATPVNVTVSVAPASANVKIAAAQQFSATVSGSSNTAVTWSVNSVAGGNATVGTISPTGLYTAPAAVPNPAMVNIRATSAAQTTAFGAATATVSANPPPNPPPLNLSHARFLEQAAFGPSAADLTGVAQLGFDPWIDAQFALPETAIPLPSGMNIGQAQADFQWRITHAPDQLRQRAAYALSQIIVISANKNIYPDQIVPYLQILSRNAFGSYKTLLREITMSPQMGKYLDIANSLRPGMSVGANENYPRELLQLFSIGLVQLNPDGSTKLDAQGKPVPTYTQQTVQQLALALTGWTYPTAPGVAPRNINWEYFVGNMETREGNHDTSTKSFLGCTLQGGQTVQQDTDATIDCIFNHPNVGPFLATRLIRSMVTSNPTPGYIQRVAAKFDNDGSGVRGDLKAVWKAILLDPEARQDTATASQGRLKEPLYFITAFVRAMGGQVSPTNNYAYVYVPMGNKPMTPPSVFNFYSPLYRIPKSPMFGPEFQIYTPTESVLRANFVYQIMGSQVGSDVSVDLAPFKAVAGSIPQLIDLVDSRLLYGRMPAQMKTSLTTALNAAYDNNQRVTMAVYLTSLSGQYAVQY